MKNLVINKLGYKSNGRGDTAALTSYSRLELLGPQMSVIRHLVNKQIWKGDSAALT